MKRSLRAVISEVGTNGIILQTQQMIQQPQIQMCRSTRQILQTLSNHPPRRRQMIPPQNHQENRHRLRHLKEAAPEIAAEEGVNLHHLPFF